MRIPSFILEQEIRMNYAIELIGKMKRISELFQGMDDDYAKEQIEYLQQQYAEQMTKIFKSTCEMIGFTVINGTKILENQNAQL